MVKSLNPKSQSALGGPNPKQFQNSKFQFPIFDLLSNVGTGLVPVRESFSRKNKNIVASNFKKAKSNVGTGQLPVRDKGLPESFTDKHYYASLNVCPTFFKRNRYYA